MSGMYNVLFGYNKLARQLLELLKIDPETVPRFRDCFLSTENTIIIYTRIGGGNRSDYAEGIEMMRKWPGYLRDEDDSFDSTYASFHFAIPENHKEVCEAFVKNDWGVNPSKRWKKAIDELQKGSKP